MAGLIELVLERDGHDQPWGFRLQGGVDVALPLSVQRVLVGTPADGTLLKGDIITRISCTETKNITHQQAADLFNNAGNQIAVQIKRTGVHTTPAGATATTSAAPLVNGSPAHATPSVPVSSVHPLPGAAPNTSARPETQQTLTTATQASNATLVNKQYNSPIALYSQENVQEAMRTQPSPAHTPSINPVNKPQKHMGLRGMPLTYDPEQSATWQIIHEEENCQLITEHGPTESKVYSI
ncbi:hypothetical protein OTU49_016813 [Cherax quadricarinatus]|uniref:PDZ domain-containing protein n=1 Tax=Cherax quadricarinatus TaxID=27406 RepID=A0AAW0Y6Y8_CHEQU